jgi:hypothetical protein
VNSSPRGCALSWGQAVPGNMHTIVSHLSTCHNIFIRLLYLGSKTTIINLITGKALKSEGSISVNGEIVDDLSK